MFALISPHCAPADALRRVKELEAKLDAATASEGGFNIITIIQWTLSSETPAILFID